MAQVYRGTVLAYESGDAEKILASVADSDGHVRVKCCGQGWNHAGKFSGLKAHLADCTAKTPAVKAPVAKRETMKVKGGLDAKAP